MDYSQYTDLRETSFTAVEPTKTEQLSINFLVYQPQLRVVICGLCREGILNRIQIRKHLQRFHRPMISQLDNIDQRIEEIEQLDIVNFDQQDPIPENTYYLVELPIVFNTFKCPECSFFSRSNKNIRKHRIEVHGQRAEGRQKRNDIIYHLPGQVLYPTVNKGLFIPQLPPVQVYVPENIRSLPQSLRETTFTRENRDQPRLDRTQGDQGHQSTSQAYDEYKEREAVILNTPSVESSFHSKNTSTFLRNSRFHDFLYDKDVPALVRLLDHSNMSKGDTIVSQIRVVMGDLQHRISSLIPNLLRNIRLQLRSEEDIYKGGIQKDFIELEETSKAKYFSTITNLLLFLFQLRKSREPPLLVEENRTKNDKFLELVELTTDIIERLDNLAELLSETVDIRMKREEIDDHIVQIFRSLLRIKIKFVTTYEYTHFRHPVILFLVLSSIKSTDFSFQTNSVIAGVVSRLVYGARLFVIGAINLYERHLEKNDQSFVSLEEYAQEELSFVKIGKQNYFEELVLVRRYLMAILRDEVSTHRPILTLDVGKYLLYDKVYTLAGLKVMCTDIIEDLQNFLFTDLIPVPSSSLPNLFSMDFGDDATNSTPGSYLSDHPSLRSVRDLGIKLMDEPRSTYYRTFKKSRPSGRSKDWNQSQTLRFFTTRRKFLRLLLIAVHLMGGSPLRGEELLILLYRNVDKIEGGVRHLIYDRETRLIRVTTRWYKSFNITRKNRSNLRFLPPSLSLIIVYYLVYVMPLYNYLRLQYLDQNEISPFLFEEEGRQLTSTILSRTLLQTSARYFRHGLTIQPYRQLINYIIREYIEGGTEFIEDDIESYKDELEGTDDIVDIQANRSRKTGSLHYSLRRDLPMGITNDRYYRTLRFCQAYFRLLGLDKYDPKLVSLTHKEDSTTRGSKRSTLAPSIQSKAHDHDVIQSLVGKMPDLGLDINHTLTRFFRNPAARFRDEYQALAVTMTINTAALTFLTFIHRTGSGKSLLYLLPAFLAPPKRIYIVVSPRISLTEDLYKRSQARSIRSQRFEHIRAQVADENVVPIYTLIFLSVESVADSVFTIYVQSLRRDGYSLTFYIDEAHLVLLERRYRPILKHMRDLLQFRAPVVFLSATLPPPLLALLEQEFHIKGQNQVIRAPTIREDIEYQLRIVERGPVKDEVTKTLRNIRDNDRNTREKVLIFVGRVSTGETLAEELDLPFYHSKAENKESILSKFLSDLTSQALITTSALGVGVDFHEIGYTIHVPPYYELTAWIQESSRIRGRGTAYLLTFPSTPTSKESIMNSFDTIRWGEISTIQHYMEVDKLCLRRLLIEPRCLRKVVSWVMDSIDIVDCVSYQTKVGSEVSLCGLCQGRQQVLEQAAQAEEEQLRQSTISLAKLEEKLEIFATDTCLNCLFRGPLSSIYSHGTTRCMSWHSPPHARQDRWRASLKTYRETIQSKALLPRESCCFYCLLPMRICARLKSGQDLDKNDRCVLPDILLSWIILLVELLDHRSNQSVLSSIFPSPLVGPVPFQDRLYQLTRAVSLYETDTIEAVRLFDKIEVDDIATLREEIDSDEEDDEEDSDINEERNDNIDLVITIPRGRQVQSPLRRTIPSSSASNLSSQLRKPLQEESRQLRARHSNKRLRVPSLDQDPREVILGPSSKVQKY